MTPQEINCEIAKVVGIAIETYEVMIIGCDCADWKRHWTIDIDSQDIREGNFKACLWCKTPFKKDVRYSNLPNFHSSLDAMAEAEKTLHPQQQADYADALCLLIRAPENIAFGDKPTKKFPFNQFGYFALATLTTPQRAEAFLRTVGKWKE